MNISKFDGEVVVHKEYRRSHNPEDIRSPLKRWKAVIRGERGLSKELEPWRIPLAEQPRARLSKSKRNHEKVRYS